ncbi:hypothetical protein MAR_009249 [Mya arenaria]|uniref:Uncharacterized protein n=1 Tax=Mya arenaria TaxID=6604 RepID=A0ABY7E168_MYAAR|nr:hypothetical protein MAR_009249 [Mya arenaria]
MFLMFQAGQFMWSRLCPRSRLSPIPFRTYAPTSTTSTADGIMKQQGSRRRWGIKPSKPITCRHQTKRANAKASTREEYYRRNLAPSFIHALLLCSILTLTPSKCVQIRQMLLTWTSSRKTCLHHSLWSQNCTSGNRSGNMWNLLLKLYKNV